MLTQQEKNFIDYWQRNRDKQKRTFRQLLIGIPIGLLFAIPICINFFSGWYKRASMMSNTTDFNPIVLVIAMIVIISFVAIFSKRHQWDMREQQYRELLSKQSQEDSLNETEKK
jgi:membrane protein YdbS with pleckstrin-like domain